MILVTGSAGFIGSAVACMLNRRARTDLILSDRFGTKEKWPNVLGVRFARYVRRDELFEYLEHHPDAKKIDTVIHMGACSDTTEPDVDYLVATNVTFSQRLCQWSLAQGAQFIYASSGAVYGDGSLGFSDADTLTPNLRPLNAYGFSKWLFDMWVLEQGLIDSVTGLRFFNVYGPNEYHKGKMASIVYRAFPDARDKGVVRLFESHRPDYEHGQQERDFIYIDEVLDAIGYILDTPSVTGIYNIGTGRTHTFYELAAALLDALGKPRNIEYFPMPENLRDRYQYYTCADMTKFHEAGYPARHDQFAQCVSRYVKNYLMPGFLHYAQVQQ